MGYLNGLALLLIAGVFLDSFQTRFTGVIHLINLALLFLIVGRNILFPDLRRHHGLNSQFLLILLLFLYLSLNVNFFCCSEFNVRMLLRLGFAISLFYSFSQIDWNKIAHSFVRLLTYLNIFAGLLSLIGLIHQSLWLKFWGFFLTEHSLGLQLYEIVRGRISATFPIFMTFVVSAAFLVHRKRAARVFGAAGLISGLLSTLLWGYRSYVIAAIMGMLLLIFLLPRIRKTAIAIMMILSVSYLVFSGFLVPVSIIDRFLMIYPIDRRAIDSRWEFLQNSIEMFKSSPLVGVGVGNSRIYQSPLKIRLVTAVGEELGKDLFFLPIDPHNIFLEFLSETGIIGIFLILAVFVSFFRSDLYLYRSIKPRLLAGGDDIFSLTTLIAISVASWIFLVSVQFTSYTKGALYLFFIFRGILAGSRPQSA